jgi:glycerol-1-phosphate dehydrogenase [NAD(P)+]
LGCIASLALFEWLCRCDLARIDTDTLARQRADWSSIEREVKLAFVDIGIAANALVEMRAKEHPPDRVASRLRRIREQWPVLSERLRSLPSPAQMQGRMARLGAGVVPEAIGLTRDRLARDYVRARLIRRRYTVFDLLTDLNCLESAVADLFRDGGFWGEVAPAAQRVRRG